MGEVVREPLGLVRGRVTIRRDGAVVADQRNLFLNLAYQRLAGILAANAALVVKSPVAIGIGTGTGVGAAVAALPADAAMGFEMARLPIVAAGVTATYTAQLTTVFGQSLPNAAYTEVGLWDQTADGGTATAGGATTLTDGGRAWTVNQWANATVQITSGTGAGQQRTVASNTATALTVTVAWGVNPDATSTYQLSQGLLYAHSGVTVTKGAGQVLTVGWQLTVPSG